MQPVILVVLFAVGVSSIKERNCENGFCSTHDIEEGEDDHERDKYQHPDIDGVCLCLTTLLLSPFVKNRNFPVLYFYH